MLRSRRQIKYYRNKQRKETECPIPHNMTYGLRQQLADYYGLNRSPQPSIETILSALRYAVAMGRDEEFAEIAKQWLDSQGGEETTELTVEMTQELEPEWEIIPIGESRWSDTGKMYGRM